MQYRYDGNNGAVVGVMIGMVATVVGIVVVIAAVEYEEGTQIKEKKSESENEAGETIQIE